jgi:uncharacterized protein YbjT (DUF2867 family)
MSDNPSTSAKKVLAVTGATGAQGGGLARAILADQNSPFRVRAITRKRDSEQAKQLAALGAEIVSADLDDVASLERAFAGAFGAFCVTNFWEHFSPEKELAQAGNLSAAARAAGLKHVIWSTLEDTRKLVPLSDGRMPTLMGKYKVPHFDAKGEADALFARLPATLLATSFYWENLIYFGMGPKRAQDGTLVLSFPMGKAKLPGMAAEDIGKCAYGIFKRGSASVGKTIAIAGEQLTGSEMAAALTKALGQRVEYRPLSFAAFRALGFPGADDLGNMFQFKHDFQREFCGPRDPGIARALNPELQSFATWLERNAARIPLEAPVSAS